MYPDETSPASLGQMPLCAASQGDDAGVISCGPVGLLDVWSYHQRGLPKKRVGDAMKFRAVVEGMCVELFWLCRRSCVEHWQFQKAQVRNEQAHRASLQAKPHYYYRWCK
jgi:hypothetical protein